MTTFKLIPFRAAAVAALFAISGVAQAQNLLVNGSFELGSAATSGFSQEVTGSTNMTGWTVVGDNLAWFHSAFGGQLSADDGVKFLDLTYLTTGCSPCGGVEQTIATTPGTSYTLSFSLGSSSIFTTPSSILATIISGSTVTQNFTSTALGTNNWETETRTFTAGSASTIIRLAGSGVGQTDYVGLDKVSVVVATPIPEPGAMALMLAGLAAVGSVASRRRTPR